MSEQSNPTSWRDVYALVRDTREDLLAEVKGIGAKVDTHLLEHAVQKGAAAQTSKIAGMGRTTLAVLLSIGAFLLSAVNTLSR